MTSSTYLRIKNRFHKFNQKLWKWLFVFFVQSTKSAAHWDLKGSNWESFNKFLKLNDRNKETQERNWRLFIPNTSEFLLFFSNRLFFSVFWFFIDHKRYVIVNLQNSFNPENNLSYLPLRCRTLKILHSNLNHF